MDTHAHLDMSVFDEDRTEVIARAHNADVGMIITVGTNLESSKKAIELAKKYALLTCANIADDAQY